MLRRLFSVDRVEDTVKVVLTLAVGAAALAASFTHVHDVTVDTLADATGYTRAELDWFGWVVAMISEITPVVGLLSLRRRHAAGKGYMSWSLIAVVAGLLLSVGAQCAWVADEGRSTIGAYLLATVPAIALALMSKVVMSDLDLAREISGIQARSAEIEAARLADLTAREAAAEAEIRKARAEIARAEAEIGRAHAEIEEARSAEISANQRAEAAEERAAISGNEAARARQDFRAAQEEVRRAQAEAAAASGKAEALGGQAGEASAARRRADDLQQQLDAVRAQLTQAAESAAKERARHARELAAARDEAQTQAAIAAGWSSEAPVSPAPAGAGGRGRRAPRVTVAADAAAPEIELVASVTVERIIAALREFPESTAVEISGKTGFSDKTVRKVINALVESGGASVS